MLVCTEVVCLISDEIFRCLQAALTDECNALEQKLKVEEEKTDTSAASGSEAAVEPAATEDSLDAFMSDVKVKLEHGKV